MSNTYRLINPHIEGDMKTKVKAKNSVETAKILYTNLSEHFNNNLPQFISQFKKVHLEKVNITVLEQKKLEMEKM